MLLLIGLANALPERPTVIDAAADAAPSPPTSSSLERIAFSFVEERAKADAPVETASEPPSDDDAELAARNAALLHELFADGDAVAIEDEPAPDFTKLLGTWHPVDQWEKTLVALHAPKAAIHFDQILANARAEQETEARLTEISQAVAASTEPRTRAGSLADVETCASVGVIGLAVLVSLGVFFWSLRRVARSRDELRLRTEALLVLASIIKSTESKPWAAELQLLLRQALRDRRSSECIRQLLRRHRELRLSALAPSTVP